MKIEYDPEVDALYVRLSAAAIIESEAVRPGIVLDYDADGRVAGVEILHASRHEAVPPLKAAA